MARLSICFSWHEQISYLKFNSGFIALILSFRNNRIRKPGVEEIYKIVVKNIYRKQSGSQSDERKGLLDQIQAENERLAKARKLLLDDAINISDYKLLKSECESRLVVLEAKPTGYSKPKHDLDGCINNPIAA